MARNLFSDHIYTFKIKKYVNARFVAETTIDSKGRIFTEEYWQYDSEKILGTFEVPVSVLSKNQVSVVNEHLSKVFGFPVHTHLPWGDELLYRIPEESIDTAKNLTVGEMIFVKAR